jgi:hypothetical protein
MKSGRMVQVRLRIARISCCIMGINGKHEYEKRAHMCKKHFHEFRSVPDAVLINFLSQLCYHCVHVWKTCFLVELDDVIEPQ